VTLTRFQRLLRVVVKRFIYSQLYLREFLFILFGRARPLVRFKVEADPPSLYLNFEIPAERIPELERELALPHPLVPIRCLEGEEPFHCLTLNVYRVSGLANGIRAEWSLYVRDPDGTPRYMVVEAAADSGSMDPVHIVTRAGRVTHQRAEDRIDSEVVSEDGTRIRARCHLTGSEPRVRTAPEWIEANDFIYWRNGICDRTFYDSGLANARTRRIDVAGVSIEDETRWGRLVDPVPRNVILFEEAIEFAMSPWWNLDELRP